MSNFSDSYDPKYDFDTKGCRIGDFDAEGCRLPKTDIEFCRCVNAIEEDDPARQLCNLSLTNSGITVALVGLNAGDLRELIGFFADYEKRLRDF